MIKIEDRMPACGQMVIAYLPKGYFFFARYDWARTWTGKKLKFINLMSKGMWKDDVIGWNHIPSQEETI